MRSIPIETLERAARVVSPRHRRWQRLLDGLHIDPDALEQPIEQPTDRDFIICGAPRSGTTLLAAMLWQPPNVLTVSEPWDGLRLAPAELFASIRSEIADTGALARGRLDVQRLAATGEVVWGRDGEIVAPVRGGFDYHLGVKWPAFWRYVALLPDTKFLICVRRPVDVITSCRDHGGDLERGLDYACAFNRAMNRYLRAAARDTAVRRVHLYDYINTRLLPLLDRPNVLVVRYERWFSERDELLDEIGRFLGVTLGPGLPVIRDATGGSGATAGELDLIRRYCTTGEALGYALD